MNRSFGIVNMMVVLYVAALLGAMIVYNYKEKDELERMKLSYAIDFASDSATMALLQTEHLDMDYTRNKFFALNPQLALDAFLDVICFNYGMYPTAANKAEMKGYIPVAAVAAYDGYYLASPQLIRNGGGLYPETPAADVDWDLTFGMKLPYAYHYEPNGTSYALNMGLDSMLVLTSSSLTEQQGLPPLDGRTMTKQEAGARINDTISNAMAYSINQTNEANYNWRHSFYVPSELTRLRGVNAVTGPSFLVIMQNLAITTARPISGFSVGGSSIDFTRMIVGYVRGGVRYYNYADKLNTEVGLERLFATPEEAALAGYYYDAAPVN